MVKQYELNSVWLFDYNYLIIIWLLGTGKKSVPLKQFQKVVDSSIM